MKKYNIKNLIFIIPILIIFGGIIVFNSIKSIKPGLSSAASQVIFHNSSFFKQDKKINVELADTIEKQWLGLSNRESLDKENGMLFIFPNKQERTFVMRNMRFPLDIIWIEEAKVLSCSENLPPEGSEYKEKYSSKLPVNYVLEVNAGFCEENGVKVGDRVDFIL